MAPVAPVSPFNPLGMVKARLWLGDVPEITTFAGVPGDPVVVGRTSSVFAGPVFPVTPNGSVSDRVGLSGFVLSSEADPAVPLGTDPTAGETPRVGLTPAGTVKERC